MFKITYSIMLLFLTSLIVNMESCAKWSGVFWLASTLNYLTNTASSLRIISSIIGSCNKLLSLSQRNIPPERMSSAIRGRSLIFKLDKTVFGQAGSTVSVSHIWWMKSSLSLCLVQSLLSQLMCTQQSWRWLWPHWLSHLTVKTDCNHYRQFFLGEGINLVCFSKMHRSVNSHCSYSRYGKSQSYKMWFL